MGNGTLLQGLPISVDHWRLPKSHEKFKTYLYFLTHLHTDHTQGLTSTWTEPIYTSAINADLVISMLKVKPSLVKPLEIGTTCMIDLPARYGEDESRCVSVTPIDANHIRGSVMFLFEGEFGKILYTGDFRLCDSMLQNPILKMISESQSLDVLYVDNTFEEVGNEFPIREQAMQEVLAIVRNHKYHRIIFGCQTIGKEDVLIRVARELKERIFVPATILENYRTMGLPVDLFTTNQNDSQLWFEQLRRMSLFDLKAKNMETPTIGIALTASGLLKDSCALRNDKLIFTVPYSNHCSASELLRFLHFLKPKSVEKIVADSKVKTKSVITEYFETVAPEDVLNVIYADDDELLDLNSAEDMIPETISEMRASAPEAVISLTDMNIIRKADSILNSLLADLDQFGDQVIYSDGFIEKLLTLTQIHQGQDVIDIIDTDDESI